MAIILFTQQAQAQAQQGQQELEYEEFVERATGAINLKGQYVVDEGGLRIRAALFLEKMLKDERPLTPCTRYREENDMFVSPLTRARHTGWAFGNAGFISVNTLVGLITPGYQLPEYRTVRANPRPNGQVDDDKTMWVIGPWSEKTKLLLFATDGDKIERLEDWITRKLQSMVN
jgi:hypothetical protein